MPAAFDILVGLHVATAVVGFGSVALSGVYGFGGRRPAADGQLEELRRYFASPGRLELLLLAVPFLGGAALAVQPHGRGLGQLWAVLAGVVWLVAAAVLLGVVRPAERRLRAALLDGAAEAPATAAGRVGWASVVSDVAFAVALGLMIFQPR